MSLLLKVPFLIIFTHSLFLFFLSGCTTVELVANIGKKTFNTTSNNIISNPIYKIGNPYEISGRFYSPEKDLSYNKTGIASWYGPKFNGKLTANGEIFNQNALTAAHKTLPLPSAVEVTNLSTGVSLILRINDRGPFVNDRIIDLSSASANILGIKEKGTALVKVKLLINKSLQLEKFAQKGYFPEIADLKEIKTPPITLPNIANVKIETIKSKNYKPLLKNNLQGKYINFDLKKGNKIWIQLGSFKSLESAKKLKNKLSYIGSIIIKKNSNIFEVKSGPYYNIDKSNRILSLLKKKNMYGSKIIIK